MALQSCKALPAWEGYSFPLEAITMGSGNSKVECIWLPGQSGKTRNMMERIKTLEEVAQEEYSCEGFLNIVISANNRSLVDQTEVRMNKELYRDEEEEEESDSKIEGTCFKWRSGLKNNNVSVGDLADKIKEGEVTMVVCCAHAKRLAYLSLLLANLEKSRLFSKRINIWIDEADASIRLWSKPALDITPLSKVNKVTLVSATYDSILKKYGEIHVLPCLETMLPIYHRVQDCILIEKNSLVDGAYEYLKAIVEANQEMLCQPGVRLFAPGDIARASHEAITEYLVSKGFAVVIVNGLRKEIVIPGRKDPIPLTPYVDVETGAPEEVGRIIAKIYKDNGLSRFPFAITGHLCLGRGITFQNENFLFTHGVLFDIPDKANAYQTACRLAGNIKGIPSYTPPMLYTTSKMLSVLLQKEEAAIHIARHVADNELTRIDKEMIESLYGSGKKPVREEDFLQEWEEFADCDTACAKYPEFVNKLKEDGYYHSSISGSPTRLSYSEVEKMKAGKKTANMDARKIKLNATATRLYVGYRNLADPSSAVFVVRSLTRVNDPSY